MNLGEQIYNLRTEKHLSQGDLAGRLDVSRQSISKWENNITVPELDKLVKMSELFGVSLDALVHGREETPEETGGTESVVERVVVVEKRGNTAGIVLLAIGGAFLLLLLLLGADWPALFFAAPFLSCGVVCLAAQRHRALLCLWCVYLSVFQYLRFGTGITFAIVLQTFYFEPSWNYMRLIIGWALLLCYLALVAASLWRTRKETISCTKVHILQTAALLLAVPLKELAHRGLLQFMLQNDLNWNLNYALHALISAVAALCLAALAWAAVRSMSMLRGRRADPNNDEVPS